MIGRTGGTPQPVDQALFDRLAPPLRKLIFGFTREWHATEDLLQETFLRAVRNLHRYRGQSSLTTWIYSIARNLCLDYVRSSARRRLHLLESLERAEQEPRPVPESLCLDPGRRVEAEERCLQVNRALSSLPPEARTFLVLRICSGLSYREIARLCRIPPTGVGVRISRALRSLSKKLG